MTRFLVRSALLLVALIVVRNCLPASAGEPVVSLGDCRPGRDRITSIRVEADGWVDPEAVAATAGLVAGEIWSGNRAETARAALMATGTFLSVAIDPTVTVAGCTVVVQLYRKPIVSKIELHGTEWDPRAAARSFKRWILRQPPPPEPPADSEVRRLLGIKVGTLFEPELLERGSRRILEKYDAAGFSFAQVATVTAPGEGTIGVAVYVERGAPVLVTQIAVRVDDGEVRRMIEDMLEEQLGRPTTRRTIRNIRRALVRRLREAGYFESRVALRRRFLTPGDRELSANVSAGRQREIEITGNRSFDRDDLLPTSRLLDRVIVTESTWRHFAAAMRRYYQERGYYEAEVTVRTDDPRKIAFTVIEGTRYHIAAVEFVGNQAFTSQRLREAVETGRRRWIRFLRERDLSEEELTGDVQRIRYLYQRRGYETADVSYVVDVDEQSHAATVRFEIAEGPQTIVRDIVFTGTPEKALAGAAARPDEEGDLGNPFDMVAVERGRAEWEAELRRSGYREAEIDVEVDRAPAGDEVAATLRWRVSSGPLFRVGRVVVEGNSDVRDSVVRRDVSFERGEPILSEKLLDAQQAVYQSGVFRNVSVAPREDRSAAPRSPAQDNAEREEDIVVKVGARPPGKLRYGVGYDTAQGFTGFGELSYANINRRAQRLRLRSQLGFDPGQIEPTQYLVNAALVEPRLFDGPREVHVSTLVERNTRTIDQYNIQRFSVAFGASQKVAQRVRVGIDLQAEYADVFDVLPLPFRERDERNRWTTALASFAIYDGRDSAYNPHSGIFESLRLRYLLPTLSQISQFEVDTQHTQLIPLWWNWTLVYSVRVGWLHPFDDNPIAPIRTRFFLGGGESVRGFVVNSLGPYDGVGNEVGGDLAIITKTELRVPVFKGIGLVIFFDAGGNYLVGCDAACRAGGPNDPATKISDAKVSLDNFRRSAGLGLRYVTPVGPISVDYGVKLDRRTRELANGSTSRESFGEFSVSVGAQF